jgi:formylglycine-generating enzyme
MSRATHIPTTLLIAACCGCWQVADADGSDSPEWGSDGDYSPPIELDWVSIAGGEFPMGANGMLWSEPVHAVVVPPFELSRTEVTVQQYHQCVEAGACAAPQLDDEACNWNLPDRDNHPINCLDWQRARDFCAWAGGRLPSESEWEYAARSEGRDSDYPWGDQQATCLRSVMDGQGAQESGYGCGNLGTWPVCSKPQGDSLQGLCDLAGNVAEWVQDWFHDGYEGHPIDGSAWESPPGSSRVIRGGGYKLSAYHLLAAKRNHLEPGPMSGVRCAR